MLETLNTIAAARDLAQLEQQELLSRVRLSISL